MDLKARTGLLTGERGRCAFKDRADLREQTAALLLQTRYFAQVSADLLAAVLSESSLMSLRQGDLLIVKDSRDIDSMYILLEGVLDIVVEGQAIMSLADPGEAIGELAPIIRQPRLTDVRCQTDVLLIDVPVTALVAGKEASPARYAQILELVALYLGGKLRQTTQRVHGYDKLLLEQEHLRSRSAELEGVVQEKLREVLLYSHAFQNSQDGIVIVDASGTVISANHAACEMFGWSDYRSEKISALDRFPELGARQARADANQAAGFKEEWVLLGTNQGDIPSEVTVTPVMQDGAMVAQALFMRDIRGYKVLLETLEISQSELAEYSRGLEEKVAARTAELRRTNHELTASNAQLKHETESKEAALQRLKETQSHLLQSETLIGLGRLAAGVAHEINNPIGFVRSNLGTLKEYVDGMVSLLDLYQETDRALDGGPEAAAVREKIRARKKEIGYDYLLGDLGPLITDSQQGVSRVAAIVSNLKEFTHLDEAQWQHADLNAGLESTIKLLWNELKHKVELKREYGSLPTIECQPQQLNQAFLNVLLNAVQSIRKTGTITIRTALDPGAQRIVVTIQDTGCGISAENLPHIYEPFFTTQPVGKGMGLGLTSAYNIVRNHQGTIHTESAVDSGTTVTIKLPTHQTRREHAESAHD